MRKGLEVWKKIPGLPDRYEVSNQGKFRTLAFIDKRGWRKPQTAFKGDQFYIEGKWYCRAGLVLRAFVGDKPKGCRLARHLDDDRTNNSIENLAWGTDKDNHNDAVRNGRSFVSYGHLGKPHSARTKKLLSRIFKGRPTGRKISVKHRAALLAGFKKWKRRAL